jgi:hypothetical protein
MCTVQATNIDSLSETVTVQATNIDITLTILLLCKLQTSTSLSGNCYCASYKHRLTLRKLLLCKLQTSTHFQETVTVRAIKETESIN